MIARATDASDLDLVAAVRDGDDGAFEELYRRYSRRVAGYVCRMVGDPDRAEDVTQEAFFAALRRLRRTESEILFKPWIFEIAKNAAIDHFRRVSRAEEVSIHADDALRATDHVRLVGGSPGPEVAFDSKQRLDHLRGAFDELSDSHSRILVLRELEGLSYREIGERMDLSRPAVESTLFRARRRLNEEYAELDTGARCLATVAAIARLAEGLESARDRRRVGKHVQRCSSCRRHARQLGVHVERPVRSRVAALLPLPAIARRRRNPGHDGGAGAAAGQGYASSVQQVATAWAPAVVTTGAAEGTAQVWSKAAAIVAAIALAGGGAAIHERVIEPHLGGAKPVPAGTGGQSRPDGVDAGRIAGGGASAGAETPGVPAAGRDTPPGDRDAPGLSGGGGVRTPGLGGRGGEPSVGSPSVGSPNVAPPSFAPPSVEPPPVDPPREGSGLPEGPGVPDPGAVDPLGGLNGAAPRMDGPPPFELDAPPTSALPTLGSAAPVPPAAPAPPTAPAPPDAPAAPAPAAVPSLSPAAG